MPLLPNSHTMELLKGLPVSWYIPFLTVQFINYREKQRERESCNCDLFLYSGGCSDGSREDVNRLSEQLGKELANVSVWPFDRNYFN